MKSNNINIKKINLFYSITILDIVNNFRLINEVNYFFVEKIFLPIIVI